MKKVSVIVPVYNCERYIERCIQSIFNQTYPNIEVIVINDGSQDSTLSILEKMSKLGNINIINKQNKGVSSARNLGLLKASGDYILFLDSDDWIEKETIEILIKTITESRTDIVRYGYIKNINEQRYILPKKNKIIGYIELENQKREEILKKIIIGEIESYTPLLFMKKELAKKVLFDEKIHYMEDLIYYINLILKAKNIYFLDEPLYHYFYNSVSASNNLEKQKENIENVEQVNKIVKKILEENKCLTKSLEEQINITHFSIILEFTFIIYKNNIIKRDQILNILFKQNIREMMITNTNTDISSNFHKLCFKAIKNNQKNLLIDIFKIRIIISKIKDFIFGKIRF